MMYKYKKRKLEDFFEYKEGAKIMKKTIAIFALLIVLLGIFTFTNKVYAAERIIDNETESKIVELKDTKINMDQIFMD